MFLDHPTDSNTAQQHVITRREYVFYSKSQNATFFTIFGRDHTFSRPMHVNAVNATHTTSTADAAHPYDFCCGRRLPSPFTDRFFSVLCKMVFGHLQPTSSCASLSLRKWMLWHQQCICSSNPSTFYNNIFIILRILFCRARDECTRISRLTYVKFGKITRLWEKIVREGFERL